MNICSRCNQLSKNANAKFCWNCGQRFPFEDEVFHLENLMLMYMRRLHQLELTAARYGIDTRPEVNIEIEELNEKIGAFNQQISHLKQVIEDKSSSGIIEFHFTKTPNNNTLHEIKVLEVSLITGASLDQIKLTYLNDGTFILRVRTPNSIIKEIMARHSNNDTLLNLMNIDSITEIIYLDKNSNLDRIISQCQCVLEKKNFDIYFYQKSPEYWLACDINLVHGHEQNAANKLSIRGSIDTDPSYPGCPHCGSRGIFKHVECGRLSCWIPKTSSATCAWCNQHFSVTASISDLDGRADY